MGFWRDIIGADCNPHKKTITLLLACGHKVIIHTDTPFGKSYLETDHKAAQCYQCNGDEYVPNIQETGSQ